MTPKEIYDLPPIRVETDSLESILNAFSQEYNFPRVWLFSDLDAEDMQLAIEHINNMNVVEHRIYMQEGDDKYGGILSAAFYNGIPIAVIHRYGRYYSEYNVFVTNFEQYTKLCDFIEETKNKIESELSYKLYHEDENVDGIDEVFRYKLGDYYDKDLKPLYKVGDIVWGWVVENHLVARHSLDYDRFVLTRVKITSVDRYNPARTYHGTQIDRTWNTKTDESMSKHKMMFVKGEGQVGAGLCDNTILSLATDDIPKNAIDNFVDAEGFLSETYFETIKNKT